MKCNCLNDRNHGGYTLFSMGFLRDILNRPEHEHAMLVMPVGYPDGGAKVPNLQRKNMKDVSYFV